MKKLLIVDDDYISVDIMKRIFCNEYEIDECAEVEDYYNKYGSSIYNIAIVDISLRGKKTGLELIREMKSSPKMAGMPVICLTAHAEEKTRRLALEAGADYFVTKPVFNDKLRDVVRSLTEGS